MHRANSAIAAGVMLAESDNLVRPLPGLLDGLNRADCNRLRAIGREGPGSRPTGLVSGRHTGWDLPDQRGTHTQLLCGAVGARGHARLLVSGNFVGGPDIFGTGPHMWSSVAAEPSLLTFMPGLALRRLALESPAIAVALLDALAFKARCYSAMAQMLGTRSVTERLHSLLIFLSHVYGVKRDGEVVIGMPFTHGDLANLIGSTRQWVTVQLARLQEEGVIRYDRSVISILDLSTLEQEME